MVIFIMKNKILILGATGFVGTNILKKFDKSNNIIHATYFKTKPFYRSRNVIWKRANLTKEQDVKKIISNYDIVFQCAAFTSGVEDMSKNPFLFITDNLIMNSLILQEVVKYKIKHFIFLSCTVMYHNSTKKLGEEDIDYKKEIHPKYEGIAKLKLYVESLCKFYSNNSKIKFSILRHSNLFGPFDKFFNKKSHFMAAIISKIIKLKKNDKLQVWGDGKEKRDFLHVDDFLIALDMIIRKQKKKYEIFNVCYGEQFSIREILFKLQKKEILQNKVIFLKQKPTIKVNILVSNSKIKKTIGWQPSLKLEDSIEETFDWVKNYYNLI